MTERYTDRKGRVFSVIHKRREESQKQETREEREHRIAEELYRILIRRNDGR